MVIVTDGQWSVGPGYRSVPDGPWHQQNCPKLKLHPDAWTLRMRQILMQNIELLRARAACKVGQCKICGVSKDCMGSQQVQ